MMMFMWLIPLVLILLLVDRPAGSRARTISTVVLLALVALPILGMSTMMGGGMMSGGMHGHHTGGWMNPSGPFVGITVLGVAALAALGYFLIKRTGPGETEAEQILKLRLAKGEITAEEYDLLRQKLKA